MRICIQVCDKHEIKTNANNDYNRYRKSFNMDRKTCHAILRTKCKRDWNILRICTFSNIFHGDSGYK